MQQKQSNNQKNEVEILDWDKPAYKFVPRGRHTWRQQGPYLVCVSCEIKHAVYIGIDKQMIGEDDEGRPKLVKITK